MGNVKALHLCRLKLTCPSQSRSALCQHCAKRLLDRRSRNAFSTIGRTCKWDNTTRQVLSCLILSRPSANVRVSRLRYLHWASILTNSKHAKACHVASSCCSSRIMSVWRGKQRAKHLNSYCWPETFKRNGLGTSHSVLTVWDSTPCGLGRA